MRLRALALATATGLVLSVAPTMAAEAASAKTPNRLITQVKATSHAGPTGTTVSLSVRAKNPKDIRRRAAHAPVSLVGAKGVFRLGSIKLPSMRAKGSGTAKATRKVPVAVPAGQYAVRVCLVTFPDRCRTSGRTVTIAPARLAASATSLSFADTLQGTSSPATRVRISNTGQSRTGSLAVSLGGTSDFTLGDSTCRTPLAPGAACTIDVTFTPQTDGLATGDLEVTDGAGAQTSVALAGTGTEPATLRISPSEALFAATTIGESSTPQTLTVTNDGDYPTGTPGVGISGDDDQFHLTGSTCVEALPAGESCTLDVIYAPASAGRATAVVTVAATPGGEVTTSLTGTGQTQPALSISDASHDYGYSDEPAEHVFIITNTGDAATGVPTATVDGDTAFSVTTNTCTAAVAGGASCSVGVTYTGTGTTSQSAQLEVTATRGGTVSAALTGSPVALSVTPAEHAFGTVDVGSTSDAATFVMTNHRLTSILMGSEDLTGPFSLDDSCLGVTIPAGGTCSFSAVFSPNAAGPVSESLEYSTGDDHIGVTLSGLGATPAALTVTPSTADFGAWAAGGTPGTSDVTITNTGVRSTEALSTSLGGADSDVFSVDSSDCPEVLAGGATCTATVEFAPESFGDKTATLTVSGAPANTVELTGLGAPAGVSLFPATSDYGSVAVGGAAYKTFRVVNTTENGEDMNSASSGPPFPLELNQDFTCVLVVTTIQPHRWCTMTLSFKPQSVGSFSTTLTAGGTNFNVSTQLSGTGVASAARRSETSKPDGPLTFEIKDGKPVTQ